jgi:hypothetical protein
MDTGFIQNLRYKLQKRVRKLNSMQWEYFHLGLVQFWKFLQSHSVYKGIIEDLERRSISSESDAEKIVAEKEKLFGEDEDESVAIAYFVIKKIIESENPDKIISIAHNYSQGKQSTDALEFWKDFFLEPFYEYIDEQLDDQKATLSLLKRYKYKCEWFQRENLYNLWINNTQKGEKLLSLNLYEYLFDQGIDIFIEPASISGEADLVSAQKSSEPLIADVKIFNPDKSKGIPYIASGFNQIYLYTLDFNEPFGYLIIFKTCESDLKFALSQKEQTTPFIIHNNKTIFLMTIDIYPHSLSASKRGKIKTIEIKEEDLIKVIKSTLHLG